MKTTASANIRTKTTTISALIAALAFAACSPASSTSVEPVAGSLFAPTPDLQWRLPDSIREISGLAVSPDGRLFAHDDEQAVIYEIDIANGAFVKSFALGETVETGDFEGLAIAPNGDFWLTTSQGRLYKFREGADGAHVDYERFNAGLRDSCEVEGLAYLDGALLLACKTTQHNPAPLRSWQIGSAHARDWGLADIDFAEAAGVRRFQPSGIEIDPASGRALVLSGISGALVELDMNGAVLSARALGRGHVQAEGVTIMPDGSMIISDEAGGRSGQALLSRYPRAS